MEIKDLRSKANALEKKILLSRPRPAPEFEPDQEDDKT